jgi:CheY-like chemotaxis protein
MTNRHILLVEDNENDIELTLAALGKHVANDVVVARDGAEALDYLLRRGAFAGRGTNAPVLVMLDLKMPKVDGLEVLRTIKADPALRRIPVVVLTSSREERDVVKSYDLGVNAYVTKPVEFEQFADAVKHLGLFWLLLNEPPPLP